MDSEIIIRPARPDDTAAVLRLAALDSAPVPAEPWLLALEAGELRAALSTSSGTAIADPFVLSAGLVSLLRTAAGADAPAPSGRRHPRRHPGRRLRRGPRPVLAPR